MELIKVKSNKERAKNILKVISLLEERIKKQDRKKMAALIIADYYEMVKELITAILLIDGYKTLSHRDLIEYIKSKCSGFSSHEISLLHDLRVLRNRIAYEGFLIEPSYLERNESFFKEMIQKLRDVVSKKLG